MTDDSREALNIAQELRAAEALAAPSPHSEGKEHSLHREGLLLDAAKAIEAPSTRPETAGPFRAVDVEALHRMKLSEERKPFGLQDPEEGTYLYEIDKLIEKATGSDALFLKTLYDHLNALYVEQRVYKMFSNAAALQEQVKALTYDLFHVTAERDELRQALAGAAEKGE